MNTITAMERMGYTFTLDDGKIRYKLIGAQPDQARVCPLLVELRAHKADALVFLRTRQLPERISLNELGRYGHLLTPEEWRAYYWLD